MAQLTDDCFAFSGPLLRLEEMKRLISDRISPVGETEFVADIAAESAIASPAKAVIAAKGLALAERVNDHKFVVKTLAQDTPGTMPPVEYKAFVADLTNFLDYMAEPVRNERINIGIGVLIYLGLLLVFAYALKRAYWKDVH